MQREQRGPWRSSELGTPLGVSVPAGLVLVVATLLVEALLPASEAAARFGLLLVVVCGFAVAAADWVPALLVAAAAWLLFDGFVVGDFGELAWHGDADLQRTVTLLVSAAAAAAAGRLRRRWAVTSGLWALEFLANRGGRPAAGDRTRTPTAEPPPVLQ